MMSCRSLALTLAWLALSAALPASAQTVSFSNTAPISIVDSAPANPYPSSIAVSGLAPGSILNIQVLLNGFSHSFPDDTAAVVVAPSGTAALLFSGPGGGDDAVNLNLVFDDNASTALPSFGALTSGTYRPGLNQYNDSFPLPGPASYGTTFAPWLNESPNGTWNLFIADLVERDTGSVSGGWALRFDVAAAAPVAAVPEPSRYAMLLAGLAMLVAWRRYGKSARGQSTAS